MMPTRMLTLNTSALRRALDLQERIDSLQRELSRLLGKNASLAGFVAKQATPAGPRGRKKRTSPFKGKKRPASPSGPLAPAVHKVLKRSGRPLNVEALLQGLKQDKYVWKVADPKKNLAARLYTMPGVRRAGPGKFALGK